MDVQPFIETYIATIFIAGEELRDDMLTEKEFENYVTALKRGEVDIVADRQRPGGLEVETRQWATGTWYNGHLIDGVVSQEMQPSGSKLVHRVDLVTKDDRPLEDTKHTTSLHSEMRDAGTLVHKVFVEQTVHAAGAWKLRGKILWSSRPTALRFVWAKSTEQVKLRKGKGTIGKVEPSHIAAGNPTLSGYAEVRLTVKATGEHVWLYGEMVDNKLLGEVTASGPIPGLELNPNDRRFYIDRYDDSGAPRVRLPPSPSPPPPPPPPPPPDKDANMNTEDVREPPAATETGGFLFWALLAIGVVGALEWTVNKATEASMKSKAAKALKEERERKESEWAEHELAKALKEQRERAERELEMEWAEKMREERERAEREREEREQRQRVKREQQERVKREQRERAEREREQAAERARREEIRAAEEAERKRKEDALKREAEARAEQQKPTSPSNIPH